VPSVVIPIWLRLRRIVISCSNPLVRTSAAKVASPNSSARWQRERHCICASQY
jgi:hypothetical protein